LESAGLSPVLSNNHTMLAKEKATASRMVVPTWYLLFLTGTMIVTQFNLWCAPDVQTSASIWGPDWTGACRSSIVFHLACCGIFYWLMSWPSRYHPHPRINRCDDETTDESFKNTSTKSKDDTCARDCGTLSFIVICALTSLLTFGTALDCSETLSNTARNASFVCFALFWTLLWSMWCRRGISTGKSSSTSKEEQPHRL
jgi:hypothetical protein